MRWPDGYANNPEGLGGIREDNREIGTSIKARQRKITAKREISTPSRGSHTARHNRHLAVAGFPKKMFEWTIKWDQDNVVCLRSCLMKAEHFDWVDRIWQILDEVAQEKR